MTALWHNGGSGWRLMAPVGFEAEAALHDLIEEAPQLLPLSGSPQLAVVGREVQLGGGYADLIAVEPSGRLAIIEIKLAKNSEARRAVVAQVLAYASYLNGLTVEALQRDVLGAHLRRRGHASIADVLSSTDQEGALDSSRFEAALEANLGEGRFRLVIVLDQAPAELVQLVGYLEAIGDKLIIDLVTVSAYEVGDGQVLVPQRVDPERQIPTKSTPPESGTAKGYLTLGADDFAEFIAESPAEEQPRLQKLYDWAVSLEREGLVSLATYHGVSNRKTLLPRLRDAKVGLVTIWNDGGAYLQVWRSVFEKRAPASIARVEKLLEPVQLGQGNVAHDFSDELLSAIAEAYREAVRCK